MLQKVAISGLSCNWRWYCFAENLFFRKDYCRNIGKLSPVIPNSGGITVFKFLYVMPDVSGFVQQSLNIAV